MIPNTDTLAALAPDNAVTLQPGEKRDFAFIYQVTTARTATSLHVELRDAGGGAAGGWTLLAREGQGGWAGGGVSADLDETGTLAPGGTFTLTVRIAAPVDIAEVQTVSLFVGSTASTAGGVETGVASGAPLTTVTVLPPPTPTAALSPPPTPTAELTETVAAVRSEALSVGASPVADATSTPTETPAPTETATSIEEPAGTPAAVASPVAGTPTPDDACDAGGSVGIVGGTVDLGDVEAGEPAYATVRIAVAQPSCLAAPLPVTLAQSSGGGSGFDGDGAIPPDAVVVTAVRVDGAAWLQPGSTGSLGSGVTVATVTAPGAATAVVEVDLRVEVPAQARPGAYSAALAVTIAGEDPPS